MVLRQGRRALRHRRLERGLVAEGRGGGEAEVDRMRVPDAHTREHEQGARVEADAVQKQAHACVDPSVHISGRRGARCAAEGEA